MNNLSVDYRVNHQFASRGYDRETCWVHARAGLLPDVAAPTVVLTMQKLLVAGSDTFLALHSTRSHDLGQSWTPPQEQPSFQRRKVTDDAEMAGASQSEIEKVVCDFTPQWHAKSGTLLGIGQTAYYLDGEVARARPRQTAYSSYDATAHTWNAWQTLKMPDDAKFYNAGAGSVQRFDESDGTILLPIYFKPDGKPFQTTVVRCAFDGQELKYLEHGDELAVEVARGLVEPSITKFGERYFLTIRNDLCGYVTSGDDGLHWEPPQAWRFDDGEELGNYNTQQHWVTHCGALFLVYTRRGLNNDHVFRHRGPLLMAQVDPENLQVIRETERVIIPERGARLGNFGVIQVSADETWVTVTEWMQTCAPHSTDCTRCERWGSDNTVWVARLLWDKPNTLAA